MTVYRPTIFGKHCLLERISVGGMAEVFRARPLDRPDFDRFLVVKRILPHLAEDEEFVRMFVDEAKIAVQLHHRSVCQIYELGRLDGSFFIVMEHIAGKDLLQLQNWLRKRKKIMSVTQACFLAMRICEGLDYAHRKTDDEGNPLRIIHRDISPQNILISFDGEVKVIDFGIARAATTNQKTQVGVLKGKFGYMSPEQVAGDPLDHRSDIFAVGTLLWEMLTARRLFYGESDFATLEKVRSAPVDPPSARNQRVPPQIDAIVLKALQRNRDSRYQWASEMAAELRAFLTSLQPAYEQDRLAGWMQKNFAEQLQEEERKELDFRQFVSEADVTSYRALHRIDDVVEDSDGEGDEATRVWVVEESAPGPKKDVHVVAASDNDPLGLEQPTEDELASVILGDDVVGPAVSATPFDSSAYMRPDLEGRSFRRRQSARRWALILLTLVGVGAGGVFLWQNEVAKTVGDLTIDAEPRDGVTVKVDGEVVPGPLPITIERHPEGRVLVELRRDEYQTVLEEVRVPGGGEVSFVRTLEPTLLQATRVELTVVPQTAQVFVDGAMVGGMGATRRFNVPAGRTALVEVVAPDRFVELLRVDGEVEGSFNENVELRPLVGDITISSEPAGTVVLDGEERGTTETPVTIEGLSILDTYELEITPLSRSFRPYHATIGFDTYYDLRLRPRLPRLGVDGSEEAVTWGALATEAPADGWYRVLVDGRETGLTTPISSERPLPLKTGSRTVTFERPGVRIDVPVTIVEGETATVAVPDRAGE